MKSAILRTNNFVKKVLMQGFKVIDFIETILLSYDAQY